jgi:hypothetical protein
MQRRQLLDYHCGCCLTLPVFESFGNLMTMIDNGKQQRQQALLAIVVDVEML